MIRSRLFTLVLIFIAVSSLALRPFPVLGLPNYGPGVKPGDEVTYGEFSFTSNLPYPIFPANVTNLKLHINTVNTQTKDVDAYLVYNFQNGTSQTQDLFGNTATGTGSLSPYLVAGNLTTGDNLSNPSSQYNSQYIFNETVQRQYAGAVRTVNLLNLTIVEPTNYVRIVFYWDALTGILLEASEHSSYTSTSAQNFSIYFEATSTNIWSPSTSPGFTFDAASITTEIVHAGETANFQLDLSSVNGLTGQINITAALRIATSQLSLALNPTTVTLTTTITNATATLHVSARKTAPIGPYIIRVNATSGSITHDGFLLVIVAPPDFIISANPASLTLSQGTATTSTITVTGRGGFNGTIGVQQQQLYGGLQLNVHLSNPFVTVNATNPTATTILTVDAAFALPGTTQIGLSATASNIYRFVNVLVNVTGPDFRLTSTPPSLTLPQAQSVQAAIQVTSILAFQGLVDLTTSAYGITATLNTAVVNLTPGGTANSTLTVSAPTGLSPGQYSVYVTGQDTRGLYRQVYIPVTVTGPDFILTTDRSFAVLRAGQNANFTVTLSSVERFNGTITLYSSVYGSLTTSINPSIVTLNTTQTTVTATVTVTAPPGAIPNQFNSQVSIEASSGIIQRYTYIQIQIIGPDFSITANPNLLSLGQGTSGTAILTLSSVENFTGTVNLSASTYGPVSALVSPASVNLTAGGTVNANLTVNVLAGALPGYYSVTIQAASGLVSQSVYISVDVVGPDFTFAVFPTSLTIKQGQSAETTASFQSLENFTGTITLVTDTFYTLLQAPNTTTVNLAKGSTAAVQLQFTASLNATPGFYSVQIQAMSGSLLHTAYLSIQIVGPDFSVFSSPQSLTVKQGSSAQSTQFVNSIDGFAGNITLTTYSYPLNVTPSNTTIRLEAGKSANTTLTIHVPTSTPIGSYYVSVDAYSGYIHRYNTIYVQVIGPDFSLVVFPSQLTIEAGTFATSTVQLTSLEGFAGNITLTTNTYGPNATGSVFVKINPTRVTLSPGGTSSATLNITTTKAAAGTNLQISITATGTNQTHYSTVFVSIIGPSFTLSPQTYFLTMAPGGSVTDTITATSIDSFSGQVTLTASSQFGLTSTLSSQNLTLTAGSTSDSILTVSSGPGTQPGYYSILVTGTSDNQTRSFYINVQVVAPDFIVQSNPSNLTIQAGKSALSTIQLTSLNGYHGNITLTVIFISGNGTASPIQVTINPAKVHLAAGGSASVVANITGTASAVGFNYISIQATDGNLTHYTYLYVTVIGPIFGLSANPQFLTIPQGSTTTTTVTTSSIDNFTGEVHLSLNSPFPFAATISPANVTLASGGLANSTLTVSVHSASPGVYDVEITGTSGNQTRNLFVIVQVVAPDFTVQPNPSQLTLRAGRSAQSTIQLTSLNGFHGNVTLKAYFTPNAILATVNPSIVDLTAGGTASAIANITATANADGFYFISIQATDGNLTHYAYIYLNVILSTFGIFANPQLLSVGQGATTTSTITTSSINNFTGTVDLSVSSPFGITASLQPENVTLVPGGSANSTLTLTVHPPSAGYYNLIVTGTSGNQTRSVFVTVQVIAPDFTVQSNPAQFTLQPGQSATSTIQLTSLNGYHGNISLIVISFAANTTASPVGVTLSPSTVNLTVGANASATVSMTTNASSVGFDVVRIEATDGSLTRYTYISVNVIGPSFGLEANPRELTLPQGGTTTTKITISSIDNFTGTVHLSLNSLPGFTGTFSPANVTLTAGSLTSSTLTFTAHPASAAFYLLIVTGTSGNITRSIFISVDVTAIGTFTITASPSFLFIPPGGTGHSTVTLQAQGGFTGVVFLSASSVIVNGPTASVSPGLVILNSTITVANATVTITLPADTTGIFDTVQVIANVNGLTQIANIAVQEAAPDFAVGVDRTSLVVQASGSATDNVSVLGLGGFTGTVQLSGVSSAQPGITFSFNPASIPLSPSSIEDNSTVTITVASNVEPGVWVTEVIGKFVSVSNVTIEHSAAITLTVLPHPDYQILSFPSSTSLFQGSTATVSSTLQSMNGFSGDVIINSGSISTGISTSPSGFVAFLASNQTLQFNTTIAAAPNTPPGVYVISINATSLGRFHEDQILVTVQARPDFTISPYPGSLTVQATKQGTAIITIGSLNLFNGTVTLSTAGTEVGVSATISPPSVQLQPSGTMTSTLTISTAAIVKLGTYTIYITGNSTWGAHTTNITLTVTPPPDFKLSSQASAVIIAEGSQVTTSLTLSTMYGFNGQVSLSTSVPQGFTTNFSVNPMNRTSWYSTLTISVANTVATGNYTILITGRAGSISHSVSVNITVAPSSKISLSVTQMLWTHRLSLSKNNNFQTFTATIKNTGRSPVYIYLVANGNSTTPGSFFSLFTAPRTILPGQTLTLTLTLQLSSTTIGQKYDVTMLLIYGTIIDQNGNLSNATIRTEARGTFTITK